MTIFTSLLVLVAVSDAVDGNNTIPASLPPSLLDNSANSMVPATFRPSIAVIIGVLTTMCFLTFLLLVYAKNCKTSRSGLFRAEEVATASQALQTSNGIDQVVIQALPTFVFSALKGKKDELECAVCLSKYDSCDVLRLLPKCKHAFHVDCIDGWLLAHPTCPLCRCSVSSDDLLLVNEIIAARKSLDEPDELLQPPRNSAGVGAFQFYVQQGNDDDASSTMQNRGCKNTLLALDKDSSDYAENNTSEKIKHLCHRIIISDIVLQQRWSDLVPSDVLFLSSQTLFCPTDRFSISDAKSHPSVDDPKLKDIQAGQASPFRRSTSKPVYHTRLSRSKNEGESANLSDGTISFLRRAFSLNRANTREFRLSPNTRSISAITAFNRFALSCKKDMLLAGMDSEACGPSDAERSKKWLSILKKTIARITRK